MGFQQPEKKEKARKKVAEDKPMFLVVSPMCAAFSPLQGLNYTRMSQDEVRKKVRVGLQHLVFVLELCKV